MHLFHPKERFFVGVILLSIVSVAIYLGVTNTKQTRHPTGTENNPSTSSMQVKTLRQLEINELLLKVEVADSASEITKGLSFRNSLVEADGMYFVLPERKQVSFWMYGMKFPLDIIWIDNRTIVGIEKNAPVATSEDIPSFQSPQPVTHVLEVNSGFTDQQNIQIGDKVTLL